MGLIYINLMVCFKKKTFYVNIYNYLFFKEKNYFLIYYFIFNFQIDKKSIKLILYIHIIKKYNKKLKKWRMIQINKIIMKI